jgi:hypothetical protein
MLELRELTVPGSNYQWVNVARNFRLQRLVIEGGQQLQIILDECKSLCDVWLPDTGVNTISMKDCPFAPSVVIPEGVSSVEYSFPLMLSLRTKFRQAELQISDLFGHNFELRVRALIRDIETIIQRWQQPEGRYDRGTLFALNSELDFRRTELAACIEHYLENDWLRHARFTLSDGYQSKRADGYQAIGEWVASLPSAVIPRLDYNKLGLSRRVVRNASAAYRGLMQEISEVCRHPTGEH